MSELAELERKLASLTEERNTRVKVAQAALTWANQDFDRRAIPLARRITELKAQQKKAEPTPRHKPKPRERETPDFTGWDQRDIDHYLQLQAR